MAKSIKLKNNNYWDSSGIIHKPIDTNNNEKVNLRTALGNWGASTVLNDYTGDLNNLYTSGWYVCNSNTAHTPYSACWYIIVLTKNKDYYGVQIAIHRDTMDSYGSIYIRKKMGTTNWSGWIKCQPDIPTNYVIWQYKDRNPDIDLAEYRSHGGQYGIYNCTKAPTMDIGILEVVSYTVDWCVQRFSDCYGNCWARTFHSGTTWTPWKKIY